jgi:hypothetical protein
MARAGTIKDEVAAFGLSNTNGTAVSDVCSRDVLDLGSGRAVAWEQLRSARLRRRRTAEHEQHDTKPHEHRMTARKAASFFI